LEFSSGGQQTLSISGWDFHPRRRNHFAFWWKGVLHGTADNHAS
jgi:hypothetical protein